MDKLKKEFVRAIMISLKIEDNPFIIATIDEFTAHIQPTQFKYFLTALFGEQHQYLNGIDRVAKVAEQFKPQIVVTDEVETKAKELISACETMNTILCTEAHGKNMSFDDYIVTHNFNNICDETKAILNSVKPYKSYVQLIKCIRQFQDSQVAINAFKDAIKYSEKEPLAINSVKKLIKQ